MRLKGKVLLSVLLPLLLGVGVMVVVTCVFVSQLTSFASSSTEVEITRDQQQILGRIASDKANLIEVFAEELIGDLNILTKYADDVINGQIAADYLPSYNGVTTLDPTLPPGGLTIDIYQRYTNYEASVWFLKGMTSYSDLTTEQWLQINTSSLLDVHFITVINAKPDYVYVQMGIQDDGFFRMFPYSRLDNYPSYQVVCVGTGETIFGYDPRCRLWFADAWNQPDQAVFTAPYVSSTQTKDLVIAGAQVINKAGSPYMVLALNVKIADLQNAILDTKVLNQGYAYVIDSTGNLIFHPSVTNYNNPIPTLLALEFAGNNADFQAFAPILNDMQMGNNGTTTFYKGGVKWYISYYPSPTAKYVLTVVVPESDVLAPVTSFDSTMAAFFGAQIGIFIGVIFATLLVLLFVVTKISRSIVRPVVELTTLCDQISKGDLAADVYGKQGGSEEISEMYKTFGRLLTALRFGNDDYYNGDKVKAMQNYKHALEMFIQFDNQIGIGICYNNIGNVHRSNMSVQEAQTAYTHAIEYGHITNVPPTVKSQRALANRLNNLAMVLLYNVKPKDAEEKVAFDRKCEDLLQEAIRFDSATYDAVSLVAHYGNLAILMLKMGRLHEAHDTMDLIPQVLREPFSDHRAEEKAVQVKEFFEQVKMNPTVLSSTAAAGRPRDITFLLDYSGSMSGAKNTAALQGMREIYNNRVREGDRVSLIIFSSNITIAFPLLIRRGNEAKIVDAMSRYTQPNGGTAFFDALGEAFKGSSSDSSNSNEQWIVALTDGEDNSSKHHSIESLQMLARANVSTNLIIVAVGDFKGRDLLEGICRTTQNGTIIDVADRDGVGHAISAAFVQIGNMMDAGVEVYNFKSD